MAIDEDELLVAAMREVDALTPGSPPIAPAPSVPWAVAINHWCASAGLTVEEATRALQRLGGQ